MWRWREVIVVFLIGEWYDLVFILGSLFFGNLDDRLKGYKCVGRVVV